MVWWFDLVLLALLVWQGVLGYFKGVKFVMFRLVVLVMALGVSLPFVANCAQWFSPSLEPVLAPAVENKAVAVGSGQIGFDFLGPWNQVVEVPVAAGFDAYIEGIISLIISVLAMVFLIAVLLLIAQIFNKNRRPINISGSIGGLGLGIITGLVLIVLLIPLIPIVALLEPGFVAGDIIHQGFFVRFLEFPSSILVRLINPFL